MYNLLDEIQKKSGFDFSSNDVEIIADQLQDCCIDAYGEVAGTFIAEELNPGSVNEWINDKLGTEIERHDDYVMSQDFDNYYMENIA